MPSTPKIMKNGKPATEADAEKAPVILVDAREPEAIEAHLFSGTVLAIGGPERTTVSRKSARPRSSPREDEIGEARKLAARLGMKLRLKLTWDTSFSRIRNPDRLVREHGLPAATRDGYLEKTGRDYMESICEQLWDAPQINWNGDMLGCCRNFWGRFGGNAFRDGLSTAINGEGMRHARAMLTGAAPPRDDIPCTTCEIYHVRRGRGRWVDRRRLRLRSVLRVAKLEATYAISRLKRLFAGHVS